MRSSGTANGSSVDRRLEAAVGGRAVVQHDGLRRAVALAFAILTAFAATRSASAVFRSWLAAKPQAPSDEDADAEALALADWTPSTRVDLMLIDSSSRRTTRTSAYVGAQGSGRVEGTARQISHCVRGYREARRCAGTGSTS